jgi:hypothetical protein
MTTIYIHLPPRQIYIDHTENTSPSRRSPPDINSRSSSQHAKQLYRVFNLKVDRQLNREYFTLDAIYNGSAGMTL